jgi:hypothetical protein
MKYNHHDNNDGRSRKMMTTFLPLKAAMQETNTKTKRKKTKVFLTIIATGVAQQKEI